MAPGTWHHQIYFGLSIRCWHQQRKETEVSPRLPAGILELRADSLALQEALYSSMLGRPGKEDPEMVEENLEFDELLGFAADQSSFSHWCIHLLGKSTGNQSKAGRGRR